MLWCDGKYLKTSFWGGIKVLACSTANIQEVNTATMAVFKQASRWSIWKKSKQAAFTRWYQPAPVYHQMQAEAHVCTERLCPSPLSPIYFHFLHPFPRSYLHKDKTKMMVKCLLSIKLLKCIRILILIQLFYVLGIFKN